MRLPKAALLLVSAVLVMTGGCGAQRTADEPLHVGVIPNISPDQQRAHYEPFRAYLEGRLQRKVELFVAADYAGVVTALTAKKIDLAYLGGLSYVQAREKSAVTPLVSEVDQETGTPEYLAAIVVPKDSSARSVRDVVARGSRFAFGDVSSTSGSLYPRAMIVEAGARCEPGDLTRCPPLKSVRFTGGHDATARAVLSGSVDAGGIELRILHRLERQGTVPKGGLRVVGTHKVMGYPWVAREGLDGNIRSAITDAFLAIKDAKLLDLLRAKAYVRVSGVHYADVRTKAAELGLLAEQGR
ncbi:phosphonate transport system substrate-binding protein [Nonomuraea polychroma]|uniref:Phosphonate transport system substrate-binding protein n=1 Tax=Nonomuraea polychroma TaxID=46176 RepID=A0A438M2E5_9ACTN|nr:phosphate/phosphite/phosphonate ABC transporter substrate-binding protein [Nonomuraea polychroma]RVX39767.1 phosphonate transport system substrate-binding protein [Nonomuraea polychroma]